MKGLKPCPYLSVACMHNRELYEKQVSEQKELIKELLKENGRMGRDLKVYREMVAKAIRKVVFPK